MTVAVQQGLFDEVPAEDAAEHRPLSAAAEAYLRQVLPLLGQLSKVSDRDERIEVINRLREEIHRHSPFAAEPVDFVRWVPAHSVTANDYNPNTVAPPEMKLLALSVESDGYTQPIVAWPIDTGFEVVDGFHRHRVGQEVKEIKQRLGGYLPLTVVNSHRHDRGDRIAATIRHNRARGKHRVEAMSDIVLELKRRNWSDERIAKQLGMEQDEILRLCQITGLVEVFADQEFSRSWDVGGEVTELDFASLEEEDDGFAFARTVNTSDPNRVFHTFEKWECYQAGFYATTKDGMTKSEGEAAYREFLSDLTRFELALEHVITEWKHSCEHYLTNVAMNRIAWLGQAAACQAMGLPAIFRAGYHLLTPEQQEAADQLAHTYLNRWLEQSGRPTVTREEAYSYDRQMEIY